MHIETELDPEWLQIFSGLGWSETQLDIGQAIDIAQTEVNG